MQHCYTVDVPAMISIVVQAHHAQMAAAYVAYK